MIPVSQDEPALQVALVQAILKLIIGMPVAGGFILRNNLSAALAVFVAAFLASGWSVVQGYLTRSKVYAPATVKASPTVAWTGMQGPELMSRDAASTSTFESPRQQVE